ncbi:MAG: VanZ family protein [Candidatus Eisenbacteria bacterium]
MKRSTERTLRAWILAIAYLALIFGISSIPQSPLSHACVKVSDKVAHLAEYTGFGLLLTVAFRGTLGRAPRWVLIVVVVLVGAAVGALDETYQLTVPGREREFLDWVADVVGVLLGTGLASGFNTWLTRRRAAAAGATS